MYILASPMTKRLVDIDDDLLEQATSVLGATTMKEAVNRSLREVVRLDLRRRHAERLARSEGLDIGDPDIMAPAWH